MGTRSALLAVDGRLCPGRLQAEELPEVGLRLDAVWHLALVEEA